MALDLYKLHAHFSAIQTERRLWEPQWRELSRYFTPASSEFTDSIYHQGSGHRTMPVSYDDTAQWAANTLAAALLGMIANPMNKWIDFGLVSQDAMEDQDVREYLQHIRDIALHILQLPEVGMYSRLHEMLLEYVIFGEAVMMITKDQKTGLAKFRPCPLQECYFVLDDDAQPEIVFREIKMSARTIVDQFGNMVPAKFKEVTEKNPYDSFKVYHAVFPRETHGYSKFANNKPFASIHYMEWNGMVLLKESGFDKFPYLIPRWQRFSGETHARGPGMFALRSIRLLDQIVKTCLKASQKIVDPPQILNRRGWIGKPKNYPGSITYTDGHDMDQLIRPYGNTGNPVLGIEWAERESEKIKRIFHIDKIHAATKAAEMREVEVLSEQEERMRDMVPQLANLHIMIARMVELVLHYIQDLLPEPPPQLIGQALQIRYMSPLARAQKMMEIANVNRTMTQFIFPLANIDPTVLQKVHTGRMVDWMFGEADIPMIVTRTNEEMEQQQAEAQQQANVMQGVQMAESMAKMAKDLHGAGGAAQGQPGLPMVGL